MKTFVDLFCGIGGFHYAAKDLGLRCVFASDMDEAAAEQYRHNFGVKPYGDIKRIPANKIPDHDILFAGFPCQPFSIIGKREGFEDKRGDLFFEILRILKAKKPTAFILENVRLLATIKKGKVIDVITKELEEIGYFVKFSVLNALDYGLPQKRERVIIVGMIDNAIDGFKWPSKTVNRLTLSDILETNPDQRHFASQKIREKRHGQHQAKVKPSIWHENKGGNISSHPFSCALRANASYNYLLVDGERRLAPREQLRLQGFPDTFDIIGNDSQIRRQTGNAVPVPMIRAVIKEVICARSENHRRDKAA